MNEWDLMISMVDLTSLESTDTPDKIRALCAKARQPDPEDPSCPRVAAVCVYPSLVGVAVDALQGSGIAVATVTGGFPHGQTPLELKVAETQAAVEAGAGEIDAVINRGSFLAGDEQHLMRLHAEVTALRNVCPPHVHLKVILETADLKDPRTISQAARIAMRTGADFVKTSTGKGAHGATIADVRTLLETARGYEDDTDRRVGVKAAGGIRTVDDARGYLDLIRDTPWATPRYFRFGASSLLDDLVKRRRAHT